VRKAQIPEKRRLGKMERVRKLTVTLSMRVPRIRRKMAILPRKMGVLMVKGQLQMKETPQPNLMHRQKVIRQMR
jgi:hypothetical protein